MTELLEVQKAALKASAGKYGFGFWLDMGLGKTLTTLSEFLDLVDKKEATRLVVVCPNSFKNGWLAEIKKQEIDVEPWVYESGAANHVFLNKQFTKPPVLIINYEAIRSAATISFILKFIYKREAMIAFDESIQLKTHNSQQTKSAIELSKYFKFKRILSGRPQTQGPHDLWAQMRAIGELNGWNFYSFRNTFCKMGGFQFKKVVGAMNEKLLAEQIEPHVFRATKADWLDLPPKSYTVREYQMGAEQRAYYKEMENEFVVWLKSGDDVSVDMALTKYIKLAQIQCGFIIDDNGKTHPLVHPTKNPRITLLREVIETEITRKLAVVYIHRYAGGILLDAFVDKNPAYIRGDMTDTEIADNRSRFNEDPKCRVIFLQATAARYGHTLVGGHEPENMCDTMIFFENSWSLDTRSQLEDRIHRIGQRSESCLYIDFVGTKLDQKVIAALQMKQSVFDAVFQHIRGYSP